MPVYKIFANKDTTIYSEQNTLNTGIDSILELTKEKSVLHADTIVGIAYINVGNNAFDGSFDPTFAASPATGTVTISLEGTPVGIYVVNSNVDTNINILATNIASAINLNGFTATATNNIVRVVAPSYYKNTIAGKQLTIQIS